MVRTISGRVLEIRDKHLVVLTEDGQYLQIDRHGKAIRRGQAIEVPLVRKKTKKSFVYGTVLAVAAVLLLAILPGLGGIAGLGPAAENYLTVDINPSVEITFGNDLKVTAFRAINREGEKLLAGMVPGLQLYVAVEHILDRAVLFSYLDMDQMDNVVMLTLVCSKGKDEILTGLEDTARLRLSALNIEGQLVVAETNVRERNKALNEGISLNRYVLRQAEPQGKPADMPTEPLRDILERIPPAAAVRRLPLEAADVRPPVSPPGLEKQEGENGAAKPQVPSVPGQPGKAGQPEQITPPGVPGEAVRPNVPVSGNAERREAGGDEGDQTED